MKSNHDYYMNVLKKGDKVEVTKSVNRKPVLEGVATLVQIEVDNGSRQLWTVKFADGAETLRWVYEFDLVSGRDFIPNRKV